MSWRQFARVCAGVAAFWATAVGILVLMTTIIDPDLHSVLFQSAVFVTIGVFVGLVAPAVLMVLHRDRGLLDALDWSRRSWNINAVFGVFALAGPVAVLAWAERAASDEVQRFVIEGAALPMIACIPAAVFCTAVWMTQVAEQDGGWQAVAEAVGVIRDGWSTYIPVIVGWWILFGVLGGEVVARVVGGPWISIVMLVPFTVAAWISYCDAAGVRPARYVKTQQAVHAPVVVDAEVAQSTDVDTTAVTTTPTFPVVTDAGSDRIEQVTAPSGGLSGAWLEASEDDSITVTVRVPEGSSVRWRVLLWRDGGVWRELEQLWNDGTHIVAHGYPRGERSFIAVQPPDEEPGLTYDLWVAVASGQAVTAQVKATAPPRAA